MILRLAWEDRARLVQLDLKRRLVIGATALAAAAFAGGAYAATQDSETTVRQAFLGDVARRLNVTPKQLTAALQGALGDQLRGAVASGKLTQAQADAIRQKIESSGAAPLLIPKLLGNPFPFGGGPMRLGGLLLGGLDAARTYLGLTRPQLSQQLAAGRSLAQIAQARGKSPAALKSAITAASRPRLDAAVRAKDITSAEEQQILAQLSAELDALVNRAGLQRPLAGQLGLGPRFGDRFRFRLEPDLLPAGSAAGF